MADQIRDQAVCLAVCNLFLDGEHIVDDANDHIRLMPDVCHVWISSNRLGELNAEGVPVVKLARARRNCDARGVLRALTRAKQDTTPQLPCPFSWQCTLPSWTGLL